MPTYIDLKEIADTSIPTPDSGRANVFIDVATGEPSYKDDTGTTTSLKGATGATGPQGDPGEGVAAGGTAGQALTKVDGTDYNTQWSTLDASSVGAIAAAELASKGDILSYTGAAIAALGVGSDNQVLTADSNESTGLKWATPASGFVDPLTTKGDIMVYGTGTTRLAVGTDGQVLTADSAEATGLKWADAAGDSDAISKLDDANETKWDNDDGVLTGYSDDGVTPSITMDPASSTIVANTFDGIASNCSNLTLSGSNGQVLEHNGTSWIAGRDIKSTMGFVNHGATAATARPSGYTCVTWIGTVQPDNLATGDVWLDTSA